LLAPTISRARLALTTVEEPALTEPDLKSLLKGKVAILGFGNRLWGDDGAGSVLAEKLKAANPAASIFDGGMVPENYLEKVAETNPETILLIDAAEFGGKPGEWRVFAGDQLAFTGLTTHAGSPQMLAAYLEARTGADVSMLAIHSGKIEEGDKLSLAVAATVRDLAAMIRKGILSE
jgi:hydrogenase 3 maturation protease